MATDPHINPATGVWDDNYYANTGRFVGETGGNADYAKIYGQFYNAGAQEINKYKDELIAVANGDLAYASKWIEANYKLALGNDDRATADFLKKVASALEEQHGRVYYDYTTGMYKETSAHDLAMSRLAEDEKIATEDLKSTFEDEKKTTMTNLNARGLVNAPRDEVRGLGGEVISNENTDQQDRLDALKRASERAVQDEETRNANAVETLTTEARRGGIDAQQIAQQQKEQAQREAERAKKLAEISASQQLINLASYAKSRAMASAGVG